MLFEENGKRFQSRLDISENTNGLCGTVLDLHATDVMNAPRTLIAMCATCLSKPPCSSKHALHPAQDLTTSLGQRMAAQTQNPEDH
jgi:hypothetical protein